MEADIKTYTETCNTIRHYSNLSFSVRVLSLVQGLTIFATWLVNYSKQDYLILISLPLFGLLFTWLIYKFHKGYYDSTGFFIERAIKIEESIANENLKTFTHFKPYHDKMYGSKGAKIITINAPFTFISIIFFIIFLVSGIKWLSSMNCSCV